MKTSDKLLISLLVVGLVTLVGATVALKAEHDKIDFKDPFYGFVTTPVKPFRVLKVDGSKRGTLPLGTPPSGSNGTAEDPNDSYTTVGIQGGKAFEIRSQKGTKIPFTYRFTDDTLFVQYETEFFYPGQISADEAFATTPFAYIITPSIEQLIVSNTTCILTGLAIEQLTVSATRSRVLIRNSTITGLMTIGKQGSLVQTTASDHIGEATITSRDSTSFITDRDVFGSLTLQNDSTAILKIPASLLKKLR